MSFIKKLFAKKYFKLIAISIIGIYALIGFFLTSAYFAVKWHLTNDPGAVDFNDRYFQEIKDKYNQAYKIDSSVFKSRESELYYKIIALNEYYPENAALIMNAYHKSGNLAEAERMTDAVNLYMQEIKDYQQKLRNYKASQQVKKGQALRASIFEWMNIPEWSDFKFAVAKDFKIIDSVAKITGVEQRLLVSMLVGEQIRLFNSQREAYKKWIGPLKILSVETTFSLGVTGIKEETAEKIERYLKDSSTEFYIGKKYEHLLDFRTDTIGGERFTRLTSYKNHYYSYLYAALYLKQLKQQWENAGFKVEDRPEILATLYNLGFEMSKPKPDPRVGGSRIIIDEKPYTFGAIAYEFYYSGELFDLFPFKNSKFDWNEDDMVAKD